MSSVHALSSHRSSAPPQRPRLNTLQLFGEGKELIIEHRGQEYRLRLTRNDKLILNK